ncbi:MAG TPA: aminotransferase class I/II-fold pyridoxal phosphate-dependent enzyme [bacterium]|jgi:alanine-synthesizing transaminase|nr:aminotransferase class I/II-fold pyridoxal phosphate-dependent enzyme [bacterium]
MSDIHYEQAEKIRRIPPYILGVVKSTVAEARKKGEDVIDFGMGNPDGATPQHIVDKLIEAAGNPKNHKYSVSRGIFKLRLAIADWYKRNYGVDIDPETEAVATIGAKDALSRLLPAVLDKGDVVVVPSPCYPIHEYSPILNEDNVINVPLMAGEDIFPKLQAAVENNWPRPRMLMLSYPQNPTGAVVDLEFFQKIVDYARANKLIVVHDFAYAELVFDGYKAPSIMQAKGAKDVAIEIYSLSKTYNMAGWRVGFAVGNRELVGALTKIKSYLDYGMFQPIQIAAIQALNGPQDCVKEIVEIYRKRRDVLVEGLNRNGWNVAKPQATMFVWAPIPEPFKAMGSVAFFKKLVAEAKFAVSPGAGFGAPGEGFVRFSLIENEERIRQALRGLKSLTPP